MPGRDPKPTLGLQRNDRPWAVRENGLSIPEARRKARTRFMTSFASVQLPDHRRAIQRTLN